MILSDEDDEDSSSEFSADEDDDDDSQFTPRCLEENSLGASKEPGSFGFWEKHTRGIGSRLMEKMGYVLGSGLGKEGEGRIDPGTVSAQAYELEFCVIKKFLNFLFNPLQLKPWFFLLVDHLVSDMNKYSIFFF